MFDICSPSFTVNQLAVPFVVILISFLAFSSQLLFREIGPHPLEPRQSNIFIALVACLLIAYARSYLTNPGTVPLTGQPDQIPSTGQRWCGKCNFWKPPRAHHCRHCERCVLKMDHHCPWTANCVGLRTLPHFMRFLVYAVAAMSYLEYLLYIRIAALWQTSHLPHYHGPPILQLVHLITLSVTNSITLLTLMLLLVTCIQSLATNTTTIEDLEITRHKKLLKRARKNSGYLQYPDGQSTRLVQQEFPYDIGIWTNIVQGMGTSNVLAWIWPFSATPSHESGLVFPVNEFEDSSTTWPPPDPDRMPMKWNGEKTNGRTHEPYPSLQSELDALPGGQLAVDEIRSLNGPVTRRVPFSQHSEATRHPRNSSGSESESDGDFNSDADFDE